MGFVNKLFDKVGDIIRGIIRDPLPTLLAIGGQMIGIPAYVTTSAITAARGGDIKDIAKAAVASYATTSFLQNTQLGADIRNYTSNAIAGDFTDALIDNYGISLDSAITTAKIATASLNGVITGGLSAAILGKDISDAVTSGFTSGLILSSTDSFFDSMNKDPNWGFSKTALNMMKGVTSTGLTAMVNGQVDPATAIGNYIAYSTMKLGASELQSQFKRAMEDYTGKTDIAQKSQDNFTTAKARFESAVNKHTELENTLAKQIFEHNQLIETQLDPIQATLERYKNEVGTEQMIYERESAKFETNKANYENYDSNMRNQGYTLYQGEDWMNWAKPYLETVTEQVFTDEGLPVQINQDDYGQGQPLYQEVTYLRYENIRYDRQQYYDAAVQSANEANAAAARAQQAADNYKNLAESDETKYLVNRLDGIKTTIKSTQEQMAVLRGQIETPQGNNLAQQLKDAADQYKKDYSAWSTSKDAAERASKNYQMVQSEIALRDVTIDAVNSGLIGVVSRSDDGGILLDNGLTMKDGRFYKDGEAQFPNAVGIQQNVIQMPDGQGGYVRYGVDAGRQMSSSDVRNVFARDYGLNITDDEAQRFVGEPFTYFNKDKFQNYAMDKVSQEFESIANRKPTEEEAKTLLLSADSTKAAQDRAIIESDLYIPSAAEQDRIDFAKAAAEAKRQGKDRFTFVNSKGEAEDTFLETNAQRAAAQERAEIERLTRNATGEFEDREVNAVKGKLFGSIQMANTTGRFDDLNPADLTQKEMGQMIDLYAQSTPEERAKLLKSADAPTFNIINDLLQQSVGATDKVSTTYSNPSDSIKESDLTKYKDVLTTGLRGAAVDLASATTRAGQLIGGALGLDTGALDQLQSLLREGQDKRMNALVGDERLVAGAIGSGVTSSLAWTLGGPAGSVALMTGIAANNAWMEGSEAVIDEKNRGWRNEKEARDNGVFSYRKLTAEENGLRTAMMTAAETVGEILGVPAMNAIMKGLPITANPSELIGAARRLAGGVGSEQLSEALTTSMQMAADKWASFGLSQNATLQDYMNALRDTALATTVAVGTAGSLGTAIENLRNTALTVNPFSEDTREAVDVRTLSSLSDVLKSEGVSENSIKEIQTKIDAAVKNNESLDVIKQEAADLLKTEGNMSDIRAKSMSEDLLGRTIEQNINADFAAQGFNQAQIDSVLPELKQALVGGETIESALKKAAAGATSGELVSSDALKIIDALVKYYKPQAPADVTQQSTAPATAPSGGTQAPASDTTLQTPPSSGTDVTGTSQQPPSGSVTGTVSQPSSDGVPGAGETQAPSGGVAQQTPPTVATPPAGGAQAPTGDVAQQALPDAATLPSASTAGGTQASATSQLSSADLDALQQQIGQQSDATKTSGLQGDQNLQTSTDKVVSSVEGTKDQLLAQSEGSEQQLQPGSANQLDGVQTQIEGIESRLTSAIAQARLAGLEGDQALQAAIDKVAEDVGVSKTDLLGQLGKTEQQLRTDFTSQIGGAQKQITEVQSDLSQAMSDANAAGLQGDATLQAGINKVASDQNATKDIVLETELTKAFADSKADGATDVQATKDAVNKVASDLGTNSDALLSQIGKTETDLRLELRTGQEATQQQGTDVQSILMQQYDALSPSQKAQFDALVEQGANMQTAMNLIQSQIGESNQTMKSELSSELEATKQEPSQDLKSEYDQLSDAQKSEVDALVKQGQDLTTAITTVKTQTSDQLAETKTSSKSDIGQLGSDLQSKFDQMSELQKAEVAARVKQGEDLAAAITAVSTQTTAQIAQTETTLSQAIEQLGTDVKSKFDQMSESQKADVAARVKQGEDLQSAIQTVSQQVTQQIDQTDQGLRADNQQLGSDIQNRSDQMADSQKAETDTKVEESQDPTKTISTVETKPSEQIAKTETTLQNTTGQPGADVQKNVDQISETQKAEEDAEVKKNQDLTKTITDVGTQTAAKITESSTQLRSDIGKVGADFLTKFDAMSAAQQEEVAGRIKMGESIDSAINTVGAKVTEVGEKLALDIESIRNEIAAENARKAAADKAAAGKAQQEQLLQKAAQNIAVPGAGGATGAAIPEAPTQIKPGLTTGEGQQAKFEGPLEEFFKKVEQTSYTQPAGQAMQPQTQPVTQQPQATQTAQGPNYYSYGVFNEIDSILNPLQGAMPNLFSKAGGLATPLMARGGLNVVHHSGKERLDFRQGAAVNGPGDGQSDDIPAMLADGEFVFPADVVAALGNGSTKAGSDKLYDMMHSIRAYHRSAKPQDLPPPAKKSPLDYLKKARR